jgi:hypothetical protein
MKSASHEVNRAWYLLVIISAAGVGTAELMANRYFAVLVVMAIAGLKGIIVATRFMSLRVAPVGIRIYMRSWIVVTALMITLLAWLADH